MTPQPITVAPGDGIGPEITAVVLELLTAAGARLAPEFVSIGSEARAAGFSSGVSEQAWEAIRRTGLLLKGPVLTTSHQTNTNITLRKSLGLFANVRPCLSYDPFVLTRYPTLDVVIIRENEEDLYGGLEYRQTTDVAHGLKLFSRPGCEKIIRYAFNYARTHGRQKVSALTKDKIMEFTDGFFHQIFLEIAADYPEIASEHESLDLGTARLIETPESFDVIVIPNLYGDILSGLVAQMTTGSTGLLCAANLGPHCSVFETLHGPALEIAGQDRANPSGLLLAAIMLLVQIGQTAVAERLHNAWLYTLEQGQLTADIYRSEAHRQKLGTQAFAAAVAANLGQCPQTLKPVAYTAALPRALQLSIPYSPPIVSKRLVGIDFFLDWQIEDPPLLAERLSQLNTDRLQLACITNLGVTVWPEAFPETRLSDHWHCRFLAPADQQLTQPEVLDLLTRALQAEFHWIKTEFLFEMDQQPAFSN